MEKEKILVTDDQKTIQELCVKILASKGYCVEVADNGEACLELLKTSHFHVVLLDLKMKGMGGIETLKQIRSRYKNTEVIIVTGNATIESVVEAMQLGAYNYITKPFEVSDLEAAVEKSLEKQKLINEANKVNGISALYRISKTIASATSLDQLLSIILESACTSVKGDTGSLMLFDEKAKELNVKVSIGLKKQVVETTKMKLGQGIAGWVASNGEPVLLFDGLKNDERFKHLESRPNIKSAICVPLKIKGKVTGVLNVNNLVSSPSQFTDNDFEFLSVLAEDSAFAIEVFSLHEQLKNHAVNLEQEIRVVQGKLIQSEKMSAMARVIGYIAHEIRNPLANIKTFSQFCLNSKTITIEEKVRERLELILKNTEKANRIIEDTLTISKPIKLSLNHGSVNDILERVCLDFESAFALVSVRVFKRFFSKLPATQFDNGHMERIFSNIIQNALQAMPGGGALIIETLYQRTENIIMIKFNDTGCGVPQEEIGQIFEPFFTKRKGGIGLGMSLAKEIIELHRGKIFAESTEGKGTTITIQLPVE